MLPVEYSDVTCSSANAATTTCTMIVAPMPNSPTAAFSATCPGWRWVLS